MSPLANDLLFSGAFLFMLSVGDEYFLSQRAICFDLSPGPALCSLALPLEPSWHSMDRTLTGKTLVLRENIDNQ